MLTFGSLFAGIGGLDLGLERSGMKCRWQVEIDEYAVSVLARHWPQVRRIRDVRDVSASTVEPVDVICGGFPCQPVSVSGRQKGASDSRWLWPEFARVLDEVRPRIALLENVPGLLTSLGSTVAADLAEIGFDAEWDVVPASAVGAPHERQRFFAVAYTIGERSEKVGFIARSTFEAPGFEKAQRARIWPGRWESSATVPDRVRWVPNGGVCRVADGVPPGVDRFRCLGNAVVPQVAELIGRMIVQHTKQD